MTFPGPTSIQGVVRLPKGSDPLSGVLVVAVEDVSFADAKAQILAETRRSISQTDWQMSGSGHFFSFEIGAPQVGPEVRSLVLSARVFRDGDDVLKRGDALTVDAKPLPQNDALSVVLDLKIL